MPNDIIQWNVKGIQSRYEEMQLICQQLKPSIIAVQETMIQSDKICNLSGYNVLQHQAMATENGFTGGVSLYIHNSILHSPITLQSSLQAVAARVSLKKTITICSLYLPPRTPVIKQELSNLINELPRPFLLLGDFNAHSTLWGSESTSSRGRTVENVCMECDLNILNDGSPTYLHPPTGALSQIDLSVCDPSLVLDFEWKVHDDLRGSDHYPIILSSTCTDPTSLPERLNFKKANWDLFSTCIHSELDEEVILNCDDPVEAITNLIISCAKQSIPTSTCKPHLPKTPWFNDECKSANKERKAAQRRVFHRPSTENVHEHQRLRAKARYIYKKSKRQSWKTFCSSITSKTSKKKVWRIIKKIKGKNSCPSFHHLKLEETMITDKKAISNLLASTIEKTSSSNNKSTAFIKLKNEKEKHPCNFSSDNTEDYNLPFDLNELKTALLSCNDSAPGQDGIHYQLLKHLPESCLKTVLKIYNHIWTSGFFPTSWRKAIIIPIPKTGKDLSNPSNYRPIALTSCLCKVLEKMINLRLMWKLETDGLLAKEQCGFRKNHSTIDHLIRLESTIRNAFVNKQHVVAIFFDLEKAYDTTWKSGILSDLYEFGFRGRLPLFIQNFLADRQFQVRLGTTLSDVHEQEMGVPQGSILSPALFSIKINNIVKSVQKGSDCSLFVDDFGLCASGSTYPGVQRRLQLCVDKIQQWAEENGFTFSTTKTQCIHFHNFRTFFPDPEIHVGKTTIPAVKEAKFLGITFDQKLSFLSHIKQLKASCQKALNILRVVAHTDWGADKKTLLTLYRALIRSKLDYGCAVYGSARQSYLKMLDPIHHQGLRLCLGAFRTTPVYSLYAEAGEPALSTRRLKLSLNYYIKLFSEPNNPAYDCVINPKFENKYNENPNCIPPFGIRLLPHVNDADIDTDIISDFSKFPDTPPWTFQTPDIRFDLASYRKHSTSSLAYKTYFAEMCEKFPNYEKVFTDGSKSEGVAASAIYPLQDQSISKCISSDSSIYTAELTALILALKIIAKSKRKNFLICSDSLSALQAIESRNLKHPGLLKFYSLFTDLKREGFNIVLAWIPGHAGIEGNEMVDRLAKNTATKKSSNTYVPFTDLYPKVQQYVGQIWQEEWNEQSDNKLFQIRPELVNHLPFVSRNRKEETVMCRLHTGHSYITHSHLLKGEDAPKCIACENRFTIKHVLIDCLNLHDTRVKYYSAESLRVLFRDVPPWRVFNFLKDIGVYYKI